ncbi:CheR family methyltransferase [Antarctobacter jejuensis]|uniref:CheR family methyltransferase n=1 Tax=Antarctobacter jejuensis TaxID=1439938 RepID=UPI003FD40559
MNKPADGAFSRDIPFSDADFKAIATLAQERFGLSLADSKKPLVYSRLSRRLKSRKISSFPEYLSLLGQKGEEQERLELISALTTNVTSFFREMHHFDLLRNALATELKDKARTGDRLRFWSAGCSSGQEPYSIAMTILQVIPDALDRDIRILATDIDPKIVEKAKIGTYPKDEIASIPPDLRSNWTRSDSAHPQVSTVSDDLKAMVTFNELNLMADWPFRGPFDAIFCRNVAIYFNQETQQRLWQRFCSMLTPNGLLFIGHSERVSGRAVESLKGVGITSYQKSQAAEQPKLQ